MQLGQGFSHERLSGIIEGARRLVKEQDPRAVDDGPGDQDALQLATGDCAGILGQHGGQPHGHAGDVRSKPDFGDDGFDLGPIHLRSRDGDIIIDRAGDQLAVLEHDAEFLAQFPLVQAVDIPAVVIDFSGLRLLETQQQLEQGALAAAGGPDNADILAGLDV